MKRIIDLHLHSHYSRATSKESTLEYLYKWGKIKGITVIGTGDFTHPAWFAELQEKLEPAEPGLFKLRDNLAKPVDVTLPITIKNQQIRFILTVEISNIYSKGGKVRKLHNLIVAPSFETAAVINSRLERIGNLKADGRPILGLDSQELLKICLDTDPKILFIPAHIWTPFFAMFGSKSGFDSIKEAFGEYASEIRAIETGLSSDPFMNWRLKELQNVAIISNSDAHSPQKLGREATIMDCDLSFNEIVNGIKTNDHRLVGTIEFFPQEGKYHYDGHRLCNLKFAPDETKKHNGICPKCNKPLTVGVDYRVSELADYPKDYKPEKHKQVEYIIPLIEVVAQLQGRSSISKPVLEAYQKIISFFGNEFNLLRNVPVDKIQASGFPKLAYAIERIRKGDIYIDPGFDGVYGVIKLFKDKQERETLSGQLTLL